MRLADHCRQKLLVWAALAAAMTMACSNSGRGGAGGGSTELTGCTDPSCAPVTLSSLTVSPASSVLPAGAEQHFTVTGTFSDGSQQDLSSSATWSTAASAIASISAPGTVTAHRAGTTAVIATVQGLSTAVPLTVTDATVVALSVTPTAPTVPAGVGVSLHVTGVYSDQSSRDLTTLVTWTAGAASIATVSPSGVVTGVSAGTTTISASLGTVSASTTLTVTTATLVSLTLTPSSTVLPAGTEQHFTVTATFSDRSQRDLSSSATWSTSDPAIASIRGSGTVSAQSVGTSTVSATVQGLTVSVPVTVTNATLVALSITPAAPTVPAGVGVSLRATGAYSDQTSRDLTTLVTWTTGAASIATVSPAGVATGVSAGATAISASVGAVSTSTTLTVTAATLASLAVTPGTLSLTTGFSGQVSATGSFSDATTQDLTGVVAWSTSNARVATITTSGRISALGTGEATITATLGARSASAFVTVTNATVAAIEVTPDLPSTPVGLQVAFTATAIFSDQSTRDLTGEVTWTTSDPAVATISAAGVVSTLQAGTTTVTATLGAASDSTTLTVTPATLTMLDVLPPTLSIAKGTNGILQALGTYSDGSVVDLSDRAFWAADGGAVGLSLEAQGAVATGLAVGGANVTATFGGFSDVAALTVTSATLGAIAVTPAAVSLPVGLSQQLVATGSFSDQSQQDLTPDVTWTSSDPAVATVSASGVLTAVGPGTATLTATTLGASGTVAVTVTAATLRSITVAPANVALATGYKAQLTATGTFSDGSVQDVTAQALWVTSNKSVATISNATGSKGLATGIATGAATATAKVGGVSGSASIQVATAQLVSIAVTPASSTLAPGTTQRLKAIGTFSNGLTIDITAQCSWSSSAKKIARVSQTALVTASRRGTVTITATNHGHGGAATVTVN